MRATCRVGVALVAFAVKAAAQDAYPACTSFVSSSSDECAVYDFQIQSCQRLTYAQSVQVCRDAACLAVIAGIKALQPSECTMRSRPSCLLYADILGQVDAVCSSLNPTSRTSATPSVTTSRPPTSAPSATTTSPQPARTPSSPSIQPIMTPNPSVSVSTAPSPLPGPGEGTSESSDTTPSQAPETTIQPAPSSAVPFASEQAASGSLPQTESPPQTSESFMDSSSTASSSSSVASETARTTAPIAITDTSGSKGGSVVAPKSESAKGSWSLWIILGAVLLVLTVLVSTLWLRHKRRHKQPHSTQGTNTTGTESSVFESWAFSPADVSDLDSVVAELNALSRWRVDTSAISDVSVVGVGSQAAVHLVKLNGTKPAVSKRLVPDQFSRSSLLVLVAEIHLNARLQHPSIVSFIGVAWTTPYDLQLLFEHMPRGDLRTHLDRNMEQAGQWDDSKLQIALNIAQALVYVHSFNPPIVHRDIKARNVMLDSKLSAKLTDFGVAREQSEDGTMTTGIGTNRWLAPEVIRGGGTYNEKCDIYSLGVLLTELDTHRVPYDDVVGVSEIVLLHHVSRGELRPTVSRECDGRIQEVIEACVVQNPSERLNAMEVAYKLRQIIKTGI